MKILGAYKKIIRKSISALTFMTAIFMCFATSAKENVQPVGQAPAATPSLKLTNNSISRSCDICTDAACTTRVRARTNFIFLELNVSASFTTPANSVEVIAFTLNAPENLPRESLTPFTRNPLFDALPTSLNRATTLTSGRLVFEIASDRDISQYILSGVGSSSAGQVVLGTFTGTVTTRACATP